MLIPEITHIFLYPFKALDGIAVTVAHLEQNGALKNDRRFALKDDEGNFINGKRNPRVHLLRAVYDLENERISLHAPQFDEATFSFDDPALARYFSDFFHTRVTIAEMPNGGFPDDTTAPGFTLASTPSLVRIKEWFPNLSLENLRRRFRHNVEISAPFPFWEDSLLGASELESRFHIGENAFIATGACSRCVVPTRDPETAEIYPRFQKEFALCREETISPETEMAYFQHYYKFSLNTKALKILHPEIHCSQKIIKG